MLVRISKNQGFTLIEVLVATFIFLLLAVTVVSIFARQSVNFTYLQKQQRNVENAQFAMNFMAKTLRTSSFLIPDGAASPQSDTRLFVYDNSSAKCVQFRFYNASGSADKRGRVEVLRKDRNPSDVNSCLKSSHHTGNANVLDRFILTTGYVDGKFLHQTTERDTNLSQDGNQFRMGLVTIRMEVRDQESESVKPVTIQSSVSLRDYPKEFRF
jgi:prepilin-type N-terminal cleavage/methylation domain-containing protein